jgi:S-adenosyl-L-methionine hydrolase (adenosine-forming)
MTSDFGTSDPYVAEMKGVLASEGPPDLRVLDLSHELPAFDVLAAALFLRSAVPRFPAGTIHLVVVDPGVGSARAPLIVRIGQQLLVGPDNRQFGYLLDGQEQVFEIDPARLGTREISRTFHGRDLFAPAAAQLARGVSPEQLGTRIDSYQHLVFPMVEFVGDTLAGRVIHVDRFGNLITNISRAALYDFLAPLPLDRALVSLGERHVRLVSHYAEGEPGELLALVGSSGLLELALREGHAAAKLAVQPGKQVRVLRAGEGARQP